MGFEDALECSTLGWAVTPASQALLSMKLGEEALVVCKPGYAMAGNFQRKTLTISLSLEDLLLGAGFRGPFLVGNRGFRV